MSTWIGKLIRATQHPLGKKILSNLPKDMDVQVIGNALVTLGVPEDKVCGILSIYHQVKPEGGISELLASEDLASFLEIFFGEEAIDVTPSVVEKLRIENENICNER